MSLCEPSEVSSVATDDSALIQNDRWFDVCQPDQCIATYLPSLPSLPHPLTVMRTSHGRWSVEASSHLSLTPARRQFYCDWSQLTLQLHHH